MKTTNTPTLLATLISCVLTAAATASAYAGDVDTAGLMQSETHQQFIVHLREGSALGDSERTMQEALDRAGASLRIDSGSVRVLRQLAIGPMVVRADSPLDRVEASAWMAAMASDPDVDHVQVDRILQPALDPNDPRLNEQWGFSNSNASLNVRQAWDKATGAGQVVASIDTGRTRHPELDANTLPGYDLISDASNAGDGKGRADKPDDDGVSRGSAA